MLLVSLVNDRAVLARCLSASPDVADGAFELVTVEGARSAGSAYNAVLDDRPHEALVMFSHQDVYLPRGYHARLAARLAELSARDASWAVAGLIGRTSDGVYVGHVWSTAWHRIFRNDVPMPARVRCVDELLLVVNTRTGIRFDDRLDGFHHFGTDIVQSADARNLASYVIDAPVIHHDKPVIDLGGSFRASYRYMADKWRRRLPIPTMIVDIRGTILQLLYRDLRLRWHRRGLPTRIAPAGDPAAIAKELGWE